MSLRYVYSLTAAMLCGFAIFVRAAGMSVVLAALALCAAAAFLVLAMKTGTGQEAGKHRPLCEEDLTADNKAELVRLLDNGQFGTAVKQVRLWFRHVNEDQAQAFVLALSRDR
ncbi:MAG: hypothetical protein SOW59_03745 [Corynebacterium sp.]|nr:hypothetical protein [Corynebacterium sp.]